MWSETGNFVSLPSSFHPSSQWEVVWTYNSEMFVPFANCPENSLELHVPISDLNLLLFICLHLIFSVTRTHSFQVLSLLRTLHPVFDICYKWKASAQKSQILSWATLPSTKQPKDGGKLPLRHLLHQQKSPHVSWLGWSEGQAAGFYLVVRLFFKGWALYSHCRREQVGLCKKLHSRRTINCYSELAIY